MENYMWRVVMHDDFNEPLTVAMFLLESDARKWASEENKREDANYSVMTPKKSLRQ